MKKALVTGATGFLGSHLCLRLIANGIEVHATSRSPQAGKDVQWWQNDLTEAGAVRELLRAVRPDVVFHFGGMVTARPDVTLVAPTFHSLVTSTINMLAGASELGCRVILAGSLTEPLASDSEPVPSSPYSAAKWASSAYGRMFHQLYRTPVAIVRPFMTFGPRQQATKLIPYVALSLLKQQRPELSSGRWAADWIYIDDVIDGLVSAAQKSGVEGHTIDLGSGTLVPVRTVVQHLVRITSSTLDPDFGAIPDRPAEQERVADLQPALNLLGWTPATPLVEGLRLTVDWYRHQLERQYA